jgi:hypothetical protein
MDRHSITAQTGVEDLPDSRPDYPHTLKIRPRVEMATPGSGRCRRREGYYCQASTPREATSTYKKKASKQHCRGCDSLTQSVYN